MAAFDARDRLVVRVKPGSSKGPLVEVGDDGLGPAALVVFVRERAVDGAANQAVVAALADHLSVQRRDIEIVAGHSARIKRIAVSR